MRRRLLTIVAAAAIATLSNCSSDKDEKLAFETVSTEKTVSISGENGAPKCSVHLTLAAAAESQGERAKAVNGLLARELLDQEATSLKAAADSFANAYTESYRRNIAPLYRDDRNDANKRSWYEYHYNLTGKAAQGRQGVTVYTAELDYYEGGAHGISQRLLMNFDNKTGRLLTLADVFTPGYQQRLNGLLEEKLIEKTGAKDINELREKGYLYQTEMYASENFALGEDEITFVYNPYEIAPYEQGLTELTIDYGECKEILQDAD